MYTFQFNKLSYLNYLFYFYPKEEFLETKKYDKSRKGLKKELLTYRQGPLEKLNEIKMINLEKDLKRNSSPVDEDLLEN